MQTIYPKSLRHGDKVAILSPATVVKEEYIEGLVRELRHQGLVPVVMPHAAGPKQGTYASSQRDRLDDLTVALTDPEIRAIICARGGYGCIHLLPEIPRSILLADPKWIVGFSDVSALHAMMVTAGIASLHAPMAKHITLEGAGDVSSKATLDILRGADNVEYTVAPHPHNRKGRSEGRLIGGNLAVLNGLAATPFDILTNHEFIDGAILFIEDISEAIYAVERMLMRLYMAGALSKIAGLVVGQFTEYRADANYLTMEDMISDLLDRPGITDIPVAFNFPCGHVTHNLPMIEGCMAELVVKDDAVKLIMRKL